MQFQSNRAEIERRLLEAEQRALEAIGLFVEGDAKRRCPVDTGNLRSSIDHVTRQDDVVIGTNVDYAINVEKGIRQRPQPFLTPAAEHNRSMIERIARRYMTID